MLEAGKMVIYFAALLLFTPKSVLILSLGLRLCFLFFVVCVCVRDCCIVCVSTSACKHVCVGACVYETEGEGGREIFSAC